MIDLGIGDPDLPTPAPIVDKLVEEVRRPGNGGYPKFEGCAEFRQAVADFYKRRFGVELDPETEVFALIGSKEGIAHLVPALIDPGDLVLMPDPCYPVYRMATLLANGSYYGMPLRKENRFEPDFEEIPPAVAHDAKLMFLNFPGNPTAACVDSDFFRKAVRFAQWFRIPIAHDAAYQMITFDEYEAPSILQAPGSKEIAVEFGSLSKTYNMTGWRIGYVAGNREMTRALSIYKNNTDTGQFTPIQKAAAFALNGDPDWLRNNIAVYRERRDAVIGALNSIGIQADPPRESFFIWVPVPSGGNNRVGTIIVRCNETNRSKVLEIEKTSCRLIDFTGNLMKEEEGNTAQFGHQAIAVDALVDEIRFDGNNISFPAQLAGGGIIQFRSSYPRNIKRLFMENNIMTYSGYLVTGNRGAARRDFNRQVEDGGFLASGTIALRAISIE
ncbi:MAG: LL-diaminopimelate aminotransferase [Paenibacillus sp.]|nr:LL-diaminopimelate aminotransferase [Paenibacillus sp.]